MIHTDDPHAHAIWAVFRLYSPSLRPGEITQIIGVMPTGFTTKGARLGKVGQGAPQNGWFLSSEGRVSVNDARPHMAWVVDQIHANADGVRQILAEDGARADIILYWWTEADGGPIFLPEHLAKMSEIGLGLSVHFAKVEEGDAERPPY